ncbi:MAG TPA: hypothetical protein VNV44_00045 [Solirubrobacteraceae bacterium]|jgi:hypothetical protein|nr:hypothetical protein [Solirubrobacteraceae bacterium]
MADRVLFIGWSTPVRGREERGLEVFNETIGLYGRLQQEGRIERFDVVLLEPAGELGGYFELHGSAQQLAAVREDEEFQRSTIEASLIVDGLRQIEGVTNDEIARQMELYRDSIARVPQAS